MKKLLFILITVLILASCASLQKDLVISSDEFAQTEDILLLEEKFSVLDVQSLQQEAIATEPEFITDTTNLITEIQTHLQKNGVQKETAARLYALAGKTYLLQNKKSKAQEFYKLSYNSSKGDSQGIILGSRLGIGTDLDDENVMSGANENGLINLERGLIHYKNGEFSSCAALLDTAFLELPEFYQKIYNPIRENAWRLKNIDDTTSDNKVIGILQGNQISVGKMLLITQDSTSLFNRFNGGKKLNETDLYNKIYSNGLLQPKSSYYEETVKKSQVAKGQAVSRILAARFLWNIYVVERNLDEFATKYSSAMRPVGATSPIQDVAIDSDDFDAVLGCVENEIMALPDGENFFPSDYPTAAEFLEWVKKIK